MSKDRAVHKTPSLLEFALEESVAIETTLLAIAGDPLLSRLRDGSATMLRRSQHFDQATSRSPVSFQVAENRYVTLPLRPFRQTQSSISHYTRRT